MTHAADPKLAVVDRWFEAWGTRDINALCAISHPAIEFAPAEPLMSKLQGVRFHGRDGVRTLAEWTYETYPRLRLESSTSRKAQHGRIMASATFIPDDRPKPVVTAQVQTLFDIDGDLIRRVRSFVGDSPALEAVTGGPAMTTRERQIFELLAQGLTGPEIADRLFLSPATVRTHVQNAMERLDANTRLHALAIAITRGEIQL